MIDTAAAYFNEEAVGQAIEESGIPREELFITTKVWIQDAGYEGTMKAFETSMDKLGLDYLDLYLVHQPFGDYYGSWRAMEKLCREGRIRAIGVCNFYPVRLTDLCLNADIPPIVDQVELHPFFQQDAAIKNMDALGVLPEAWGPLAEGKHGIFDDERLRTMAESHGKTVAQIVLRWNVQRGVCVIPKSVHPERIKENIGIWDFSLTEKEMDAISEMDTGRSGIIDHGSPDTVRMLNSWKIHD